MDVLFAIGMLGLMAAAIALLGRGWPRSSRGGGYRAGRGYGAGDRGTGSDATPPVPEDDDARWRWSDDRAKAEAGDRVTPEADPPARVE